MLSLQSEPLSVNSDILGYIGELPVTNTMVMAIFNFGFFIILCIIASRFRVKNPGKLQLFIENILNGITGMIEQVVGNRIIAWKIMPLVATLVVFILVSNLIMTFLPFLSGFTYDGKTLFRSHTDDFNTTVALSFGMVTLIQVVGIVKRNPIGHIFKYIQIPQVIAGFRQGLGGGFLALINAFTGVLDIVSEVARIVSLSLRLFGNMFAGELLVGVLMSMFAIGLPIPIILLSTLSGFIQALVFGSLTASFLAGVLEE